MRRGEIRWTELPEPSGSEPGFRRPVLVIQDDIYSQSRLATVICVVLTSNLALADMPGNLFLRSRETGLPKDCVVNATQIVTVDRAYIGEAVSMLPDELMFAVDNALREVLCL